MFLHFVFASLGATQPGLMTLVLFIISSLLLFRFPRKLLCGLQNTTILALSHLCTFNEIFRQTVRLNGQTCQCSSELCFLRNVEGNYTNPYKHTVCCFLNYTNLQIRLNCFIISNDTHNPFAGIPLQSYLHF